MNSIKKIFLALVAAFLVLLLCSWQFKNFGILLLSVATLASAMAVIGRNYENYFLPVIFTLISLAIFEFVTPLLNPSVKGATIYDPDSDYGGGHHDHARRFFPAVDGFGYLIKPGVHTSRKLTREGEEIYAVAYTIGEDGYRKSPKSDQATNYLYGGSFVFGEGLNDDETIPHYLWANHSIAVRNRGIPGFGLHQALYNIEHGNAANEGINIILTAPWHALRSACKPSWSAGTPRYIVVDGYAHRSGVCTDNSVLIRVLRKSNIFKIIIASIYNEAGIQDEDIELYIGIIKSIAREVKKTNSMLVVAFIKATDEQMQFTKWTNDSLMKEISEISDVFVDVTLSERRASLSQDYYIHELDQHPSSAANRKRAKLIASSLSQFNP